MSFAPKTSIGRYEIVSVLGKGGMGDVYLAQDTELDRKVAIKFLSGEFSEDSEKLNRFIQEAKAASALNHPNILTVYEIGKFENDNFIVTEQIDGKTISDILKDGQINVRTAIDYAIQVSSALGAAHDAGIIHRDIKPNNVMVRTDGIVKLLDFGLAKLTDTGLGEALDPEAATIAKVLTIPGMLMGTPNYMSPEQARGFKLDVRTDIFSFGVLFYEMLTGVRPFDGETIADTIGAVLKDPPPPLTAYLQDIPAGLEHILDKTLRKDRELRFQSVKDLVIDLKDLRDELKFEAKLVHSLGSTKTNLIHQTDSVIAPNTVRIAPNERPFPKFSLFQVAGLFLATFLVFGGIWWVFFNRSSVEQISAIPANLKKTDIVSWNSSPGEMFSAGQFSPDGKMVAFSSTRSGSKNIWIKQPESGSSVQITKDEFNNQNPVWSPEGDEIAFFSERGNRTDSKGNITGIWRIPALGGTPVSVAAVGDGGSQLKYWSKSGVIYYQSESNLFAVDSTTGNPSRVTNFSDEDSNVKLVSISNDEQLIAYAQKDGKEWKIFSLPVSGGDAELLAESPSAISNLVWHSDNKSVLYSAFVDGTFQIFIAGASVAEPRQITFSESGSFVVDVSADGKAILFGSSKEESNLWQVDIDKQTETAISSTIDAELWPSVSANEQELAFQSVKNLSQGNNLMKGSILIRGKGSDSQTLRIAENGFLPTWSPDGSSLAFMRIADESSQIWTVKATGGQEKKLTDGAIPSSGYSVSPYNRIQTADFSWSPDGRSIAYISVQNGMFNVWVVDANGGGDAALTENSNENVLLYCPIWSSDGSKIAYYSKQKRNNSDGKNTNSIWSTDLNKKETKLVFEKDAWMRLIGWSESDKSLVLASPTKLSGLPPVVMLTKVNIETGEQSGIADLSDTYYYNINLSPDKRSIAYVAHLDGKDNIWTINSNGEKAVKLTGNNDPNLYFSSLAWSPDSRAIYFGKQTRYSLLSMITNFQ